MKPIVHSTLVPAFLSFWVSQFGSSHLYAQTKEEPKTLLGMDELREEWKESGFEANLTYKGEYVNNLSGGVKRKAMYLGNLDLVFDLELEKMAGMPGLSAQVYFLGNHGGDPSEVVGDAIGSSNIESPGDYLKLYQLWFLQKAFDDRFQLLLGLHDLNSEFYATEGSSVLLSSAFGMGPEVAQSGVNGPSIFPTAAVAAVIGVRPYGDWLLQAGAYNGRAGNPDHVGNTYARYDPADGVLNIAELGIDRDEGAVHYMIGAWSYSKKVSQLSDTEKKGTSSGVYFLVNHGVADFMSLFLRYGKANEKVLEIKTAGEAGLTMKMRSSDQLALGYAWVQPPSGPSLENESVVELTYKAYLARGISIQPDLQFIMNPSFSGTKDASVLGLRAEFVF